MRYEFAFTCLHSDYVCEETLLKKYPCNKFIAHFTSFTEAIDFANRLAEQLEESHSHLPKIYACSITCGEIEYLLRKSDKTGELEIYFRNMNNGYRRDLDILNKTIRKEDDTLFEEAFINSEDDIIGWVLSDGLEELFDSLKDKSPLEISLGRDLKERLETARKNLIAEGFKIIEIGAGYKVIYPEEI